MKQVVVLQSSQEDFFKRGKEIAKLVDEGKPIPDMTIICFDSADEVANFLTPRKIALFRAVKERPASITELAKQLQRDRSAVKRDVDDLENAGLVCVQVKTLPGHGTKKEVSPVAKEVKVELTL